MIKMQWLPLILMEERRQSLILFMRDLFYLCYLIDLDLVLKFQFSFVIYIYTLYLHFVI